MSYCGQAHHSSKLNEEKVLNIRNELSRRDKLRKLAIKLEDERKEVLKEVRSITCAALAKKHNVSEITIREINSRKTWRHI